METNARNTVIMIFQHVDIFFTMLDHYSDHSKNTVGFQISTYESVVANYLSTSISDSKDRQRILAALSVNNMEECGLLSFINDNKGQFALQRGLLQTIQGLDSRRIRELGQPDLDIIYAQMKSLYDYFSQKGGAYERYDHDFNETVAALMDCLQDTLTKIDHNVRALEGSSKRLSEILESHDFNQMVMTDQVRNALDEVLHISRRNIMPILTFLNEKAMVSDSSAVFLIRKIRESFERTSFHSELANISAIEMKLLSYSEVVKEIRMKLYRYVEMDQHQRALYNAVEQRFNTLYEAAVARLDTKLTGKKVPASDPLFMPSRFLWGLNNWSLSGLTGQPIQMAPETDSRYVIEHIRDKLSEADALSASKRAPSERKGSIADSVNAKSHVKKIRKAMQKFPKPSLESDLYESIHRHLRNNLENYKLQDIYDALPLVKNTIPTRQTLNRKTIDYGNQVLTYMSKKICKASNEH